ncbi:MAG: hypothetical protein HQK83_17090 [Fibrobacteria bacterium]|nr:hypothetical protein [Fibrobacteria bacterium]
MKITITLLLMSIVFVLAEKPKVSVHELKSLSLEKKELQAISGQLTAELFNTGNFIVLERSNMEALMAEQMLQESELTEGDSEPKSQPVSADLMLSGMVEKEKKVFTTSLKIVEIKTGIIINTISEEFKGSFKKYLDKGLKQAVASLTKQLKEQEADNKEK